jgi:hypothetical protein
VLCLLLLGGSSRSSRSSRLSGSGRSSSGRHGLLLSGGSRSSRSFFLLLATSGHSSGQSEAKSERHKLFHYVTPLSFDFPAEADSRLTNKAYQQGVNILRQQILSIFFCTFF